MFFAWSDASPLKNKHDNLRQSKEAHFNRTMAHKVEFLTKVESSLNKTLGKLKDVKDKINDAKDRVKAKVMDKLAKEVEKWAAVGDKLQQHKSAAMRKLTEKVVVAHAHHADGMKSKLTPSSRAVSSSRSATTPSSVATGVANKNGVAAVPTVASVVNVNPAMVW